MPLRRRLPLLPAALAAAGLTAALASTPASAAATGPVRINELQVIGTHNSYKREISRSEEAAYDALVRNPGDYARNLAYSHVPLADQFELQGVRGLELDLFPDPTGGLYRRPALRNSLGLGPLPDPAWDEPGIKTFHVADLDYETTCVRFTTCLEQVRGWSEDNPGHVPLLILLELKGSDPRVVAAGGVQAPAWDGDRLDELDAEIRSVFGEDDMITPDDVRRGRRTLEDSVLTRGWPRLNDSRGKVVFLLDNEPGTAVRAAYRAGRPSLEGRVLFTNAVPGDADAAFIKRNEPREANTAQIQELVRRGYLVRTRSDLPLASVLTGDTSLLDAALPSGAQLISTDFPEVGMSARYGRRFVARLPEGGTVRCNPVNARANCRDDRLERLRP